LYSLGDKQLCQNFEPNGLVTLTFDLVTSKVVSESCVTWATSVPILVFLGLFVLDLGPIYVTDRR